MRELTREQEFKLMLVRYKVEPDGSYAGAKALADILDRDAALRERLAAHERAELAWMHTAVAREQDRDRWYGAAQERQILLNQAQATVAELQRRLQILIDDNKMMEVNWSQEKARTLEYEATVARLEQDVIHRLRAVLHQSHLPNCILR